MDLRLTHLKEAANPVIQSGPILQRACACGNHALGGKCSSCAKGQSSGRFAGQFEEVAARSTLPQSSFLSGTDFSGVRVYSDHSQSVGPATPSKNVAFEDPSRPQPGSTLPYRQSKELADCIRIMGPGSDDYCRQEVLGEAPRCPDSQKSEKMKGCIQPVVIADDDGKNPTTAPSFDQVVSIWSKCCIDYTINAAKTVKKTAYQTLEESATNSPSTEEADLFRDAGASTCIQVFVPSTFSQGGDTGKHISGGAGTYDRGTSNPKVVVVEGAVSEVVAHEVGHASGFAGHAGAGETVMKATNAHDKPNPHAVSNEVCTRARTGSVLTKAGSTKDCCIIPD